MHRCRQQHYLLDIALSGLFPTATTDSVCGCQQLRHCSAHEQSRKLFRSEQLCSALDIVLVLLAVVVIVSGTVGCTTTIATASKGLEESHRHRYKCILLQVDTATSVYRDREAASDSDEVELETNREKFE